MIAELKPYPKMRKSGVPLLKDIPEHWDAVPLGRIGRFLKGAGGTKEDEVHDGVPCIRYGDLYTQYEFFITAGCSFVTPERARDYTPILFGDLLFAGSGETIDEIGKSAENLIESKACCGGDVLIFRPAREAAPRFLGYAAECLVSVHQKARMGRGVTVIHIYAGELKRLRIALPPVDEQAEIVRFLDHSDRRILRAIRAKQGLVTLLNEQKQAVIQRAVTRGLDPVARLKPSGIEWLGDIPEAWEVCRLGQIAESFRTGPFGSVLHESDYVDGGIPLVNPTHMRDGVIVEDARRSVSLATAEQLSAHRLEPGDLVFARRGELGRCALVRARERGWLCGTGSIRVRLTYRGIDPEYLIQALQVRSIGEYLSLHSVGATMGSLNTAILRQIPLILPSEHEQRQLLDRIRYATAVIDQGREAITREIDLLREYRDRLISDVVTGRIDLREAAARLPDELEEPEPLDETETDKPELEPAEA